MFELGWWGGGGGHQHGSGTVHCTEVPGISLRVARARKRIVAQLELEVGPVDEAVEIVDIRLLEPLDKIVVQPQHLQVMRQALLHLQIS
jgi:hypothetical protein